MSRGKSRIRTFKSYPIKVLAKTCGDSQICHVCWLREQRVCFESMRNLRHMENLSTEELFLKWYKRGQTQ